MQYIKDPQKKSEDFLGHFMRNDDGTYIEIPIQTQLPKATYGTCVWAVLPRGHMCVYLIFDAYTSRQVSLKYLLSTRKKLSSHR